MTTLTNHNTSTENTSTLAKIADAAAHTSKLAIVVPAMVAAQFMENHDQDSKAMQERTGSPGVVATVKALFHYVKSRREDDKKRREATGN